VYRIEQALEDKTHRGPLPASVHDRVEAIRKLRAEHSKSAKGDHGARIDPFWEPECVIDRMRRDSRILEPNEIPEPYRSAMKHEDSGRIELMHLTDIHDPKKLSERIRWLYKQSIGSKSPKEARCRVLHQGLTLAPRVGEQFALELLNLVPSVLSFDGITIAYPPTPAEIARIRGQLVNRALLLAAQYGRVEYVQKLMNQFIELVRVEPADSKFLLFNVAMGECLRNLKKLGMLDQIARLLSGVQPFVFPEGSLPELRTRYGTRADTWVELLQTRLHLASGWHLIGQANRSTAILDEVRAELYGNWRVSLKMTEFKDYAHLAIAYIAALGYGPSEAGLLRIREFFDSVQPQWIPNVWTGKQIYSRFHLMLIEEVINALTGDEFALGPAGRKWLDDDEYIVRSRIHADMKRERERSGL
jgi:hypothetical protein